MAATLALRRAERARCARARLRATVLLWVLVALGACQDRITGPAEPPVEEPPPLPAAGVNPLAGARFYVEASSNARRQATLWRATRPADAALMDRIAAQPQAAWFGDWNQDVAADVARTTAAAAMLGTAAVLVAYNIPQRDCGLYSAGGAPTAEAYRQWIEAFARGIGDRPAVVVVEPDALGATRCLSEEKYAERLALLRHAVEVLRARSATRIYLDAGNPRMLGASAMASRLLAAGVALADGFALNVSNFFTTAENIAYGKEISRYTGGKHFVIDTSRNGRGATSSYEWCNPRGRALGPAPTTRTADPLVDAYLWVKAPGESDGTCNGGPAAGTWWPEYALELARNAEG